MTNAIFRPTGVLCATAALCLGAGCAEPVEGDQDIVLEGTAYYAAGGPTSLEDPRAAFAALVATADGTLIRVLDASGRAGLSVPVGLPFAEGLTVHPDGFFLVKSQRALYRVDPRGEAELFTDTEFLWLYGASVSESGAVTVAAETELVELDGDGALVNRVPTGGAHCWMDLTVDAGADSVATVVDLWGSTLATLAPGADRLHIVEELPFDDIDITAQDDAGRQWFARSSDGTVYAWDDTDGGRHVASLDGIEGVRALLPRRDGTVTVVAQTELGVTGVSVALDGTQEVRFEHPGAYWLDVASVP